MEFGYRKVISAHL